MPDVVQERELDLRDYLTILRRRKWIVITTTLVVIGLAVAMSLLQTKSYRATAELLLQPRASERIFAPSDGTAASGSQSRVDTEIQVMKSRSIESAVAEELHHAPRVSISPKGETDVVTVSATSSDPRSAAKTSNTYAEIYIRTRREQAIEDLLAAAAQVQAKIAEIDSQLTSVDSQVAGDPAATSQRQALSAERASYSQELSQLQLARNLTESGGAQLISHAVEPRSPIRPAPRRDGVIGALVGLLFGAGLALLANYFDDSIRSREELEHAARVPVLGTVPYSPASRRRRQNTLVPTRQFSATAEAYRSIRTSLQFMRMDTQAQLIQVTSPAAGDGKTTTVANLAIAFANAGDRVLVVSCDLRQPKLHELFGLDNSVGFTSVVIGETSLAGAVQASPTFDNVSVLPSGPKPTNPSEMLSSSRTGELFASFRTRWDVVLIDSPPILPVSDALGMANFVDSIILVGAAGKSTQRSVRRAVDSLRLVGAPLECAILNKEAGHEADEYGYGYGYGEPRGRASLRRSTSEQAAVVGGTS